MIKVIFWILITMLLLIAMMIGSLFLPPDSGITDRTGEQIPQYHLQIIVQNTSAHFWKLFREGAEDAAESNNVYVEFVQISQLNVDDLTETIEKGIYADVDGMALQIVDFEESRDAIEAATAAGIQIVTFENDKQSIPGIPTVGSNSYDIGKAAGEMAVRASGASANVAVILGSAEGTDDLQHKNMIIQGITEIFSIYGQMNLTKIYTLDTGLFEAEKQTYSLLDSNTDVDLIICADERSTPGVAQVLVDNSMVGEVQVIGYGLMPATLDYIERGVIYGSICPDAYGIGYSTVEQLIAGLNEVPTSDIINTDLDTIDMQNVADYKTVE